jgi:hypothetical protein
MLDPKKPRARADVSNEAWVRIPPARCHCARYFPFDVLKMNFAYGAGQCLQSFLVFWGRTIRVTLQRHK